MIRAVHQQNKQWEHPVAAAGLNRTVLMNFFKQA